MYHPEEEMMAELNKIRKLKLGLALSGGGARGFAHIGLLKVLDREKINPSFLSGTSMGAIIAAAYASGMTGIEIEREALKFSKTSNLVKVVHLTPPYRGLINQAKVKEYLTHLIPSGVNFSELKIPLAVCATDLTLSRAVSITNGSVLTAVLASASIPGVFPPVEVASQRLVDGGVVNNMPVDLAYQIGAEKVIAVDVQLDPRTNSPWQASENKQHWPLPVPEYFMDLVWSEVVMSSRITEINLAAYPPDLYLRMPLDKEVNVLLSFPRAQEIIDIGEMATEAYLPRIRELIGYPREVESLSRELQDMTTSEKISL
jgi:NTE family protein